MTRANTHFFKPLLFSFLVVLNFAGTASATWWNDEWSNRRKVTIDTSEKGASITDPIGATPVLLRLFEGNFQFSSAKDDGGDLRIVAGDDKTALKYHIEKWDALMGEAFVWVNMPDLKPGAATNLWLYYGNNGPKAMRADDAKGTYDKETVLVYHFNERNQPAADSSGNNNNALNAGTPVEAMIGGGLRLGGTNVVTIPATMSLEWIQGGSLTWSAWVKLTSLKPHGVIFSRRDLLAGKAFLIGSDNGVPFVEVTDAGNVKRTSAEVYAAAFSPDSGAKRTPGGTPVQPGPFHHLAVVAGAGKIILYLDGVAYSGLDAQLPAMNTPMIIGGDATAPDAIPGEAGVAGELDELVLSKVARPVGYIQMAAIGQGSEKAGKLLAFAPEEAPSNWMSAIGYIGIIVRSLTVDGWVVIGLLAIMAFISWYVMISKASYLNASARGNALFMKEWRHLASDLTKLDNGDSDSMKTLGGRVDKKTDRAMRSSCIYRIYHIGADEIRHRLNSDKGLTSKKIGARSIQAIRAALDAGMVRENQKLNNQMVLLTIAISGGPFLGLLGTVVGVMITFAAVAQAGDVNVNAIAPGIAAALLATVAGLGVAIPSLFGYNYLLGKVKDASSDMAVFIDEFVSKMAEYYGGKAE